MRKPGKEWLAVNANTLDTGRLYRWPHPDGSGRSIALAVFDGPVSRDLAFGTPARDAGTFLAAVRKAADSSSAARRHLVLAATDGELYGHHKKFADPTLAYATQVGAASAEIEVTNLAAFVQRQPPTWEAQLHSGCPWAMAPRWRCCTSSAGSWRSAMARSGARWRRRFRSRCRGVWRDGACARPDGGIHNSVEIPVGKGVSESSK